MKLLERNIDDLHLLALYELRNDKRIVRMLSQLYAARVRSLAAISKVSISQSQKRKRAGAK